MKKIMYMAVAAVAALSSCSSDEFAGSNGNNGDAKVFTATIENDGLGSRSTLTSEKKVNWETTDEVSINGVTYTTMPDADATKATFTKKTSTDADPTATYKAVYPATMASGSGASITFSLPASYTYAADKFNMPMYAQSATTELGFQNICGVLAITVTSAEIATVKSITVTSNNAISGTCTISETSGRYSATATGTADADKKVTLNCETAVTLDATGTVFYLPVPAATHNLKVEVSDGTITKSMTKSSVAIERSKIYSVAFSAKHTYKYGHEVVDLGLTSGLLWATCNVGATNPQDYGDYFAWGATTPWYESGHSQDSPCSNWISGKTGYDWASAPFNGGNSSYNATAWEAAKSTAIDASNNLLAANDAATQSAAWGTGWRMPTSAEFLELARGCYIEWTDNYNSTGVKGIIVYKTKNDADKGLLHTSSAWKEIGSSATSYSSSSKTATTGTYSVSDTHIFLPAAGYRSSTNLSSAGSVGNYWSSSLGASDPGIAFYLNFNSINVRPQNYRNRYYGQSVRPVYQ